MAARAPSLAVIRRTAAAIAGTWQLAVGAFSSTPEKSKASGAEIGLSEDRVYGAWQDMLDRKGPVYSDCSVSAEITNERE